MVINAYLAEMTESSWWYISDWVMEKILFEKVTLNCDFKSKGEVSM